MGESEPEEKIVEHPIAAVVATAVVAAAVIEKVREDSPEPEPEDEPEPVHSESEPEAEQEPEPEETTEPVKAIEPEHEENLSVAAAGGIFGGSVTPNTPVPAVAAASATVKVVELNDTKPGFSRNVSISMSKIK